MFDGFLWGFFWGVVVGLAGGVGGMCLAFVAKEASEEMLQRDLSVVPARRPVQRHSLAPKAAAGHSDESEALDAE